MNFKEYKFLIQSDFYRISGEKNAVKLFKRVFRNGSFKYIFWMRTCSYAKSNTLMKSLLFPFAIIMLNHLKYKLGISVPYQTRIDSGFYIGHFGGIFVSSRSVIGKNCTLSQRVTIGQVNRGKNKGFPILGDNVYIAPGANVSGSLRIGNNVAIGANCVVTKDIPDNSVVVGIPGRIISKNGVKGYVNNTDYETKLV